MRYFQTNLIKERVNNSRSLSFFTREGRVNSRWVSLTGNGNDDRLREITQGGVNVRCVSDESTT